MRIWHYALLPYLPDAQFKGQLRELVAIMHDWRDKGQTNHLLINKVMEYSKFDLYSYFMQYCEKYEQRFGKEIDKNRKEEFAAFASTQKMMSAFHIYEDYQVVEKRYLPHPFNEWHNYFYLRACMANLYEKHHFGIGKSRITDEEWARLCEGYKTITGEDYEI